jgi:hypothetical protein
LVLVGVKRRRGVFSFRDEEEKSELFFLEKD